MGVSSVIVSLAVLVAVSWASPYPSEQASNVSTTQNETSPSVQTTPPTLEQNLQGDKFNQFDWKLCKALAEAENGNVVISPISLKLVLAMVFEGASGNTARELESALGLIRENTGRQITRKKFSTIVGNLKSSEGEYELALGTSIFIDKSVTPKPTYVRKLQSFYEAQIEQVDFSNTPESIAAINAWAAGATKGQIQNFLSSGDASANTVLMLLNAIYFKGKWLYTFPLNQTAPGTFYAYGKTPVNVTFMNSAYYLSYLDATEINAQIVRLPYVGKKFAMYIIVPNNATGLPALVKEIDPFVLKKHTQNMYETLVELSLPSFTIEYTSNLGSILKQLGIKKLFGSDAELNEIAELANNSIAVSNVLQKAGIQVNEEGSTAFAATEAQVVNKFGDSPIVSLKVDRPFLFFIKDEETDTVLFVGNLVNPGGKAAKPDKVTPPVTKVTPPVTKVTEKTPVEPTVVPTKEETTTAIPPTTTSQNGVVVVSAIEPDDGMNRFGSNSNSLNKQRFNYFDSELLEELSKQNEGNIVISTASIKSILALIVEGSQGTTYNQLVMMLRLPNNHTAVQTILRDFQKSLKNTNTEVTMESASRIFLSQDMTPDPRYKKLIQDYYNADITRTNFATPEITAHNINNWVKSHTHGFIPNLIDAGSIQPDSHLIMANAIFFKGDWQEEFQPSSTIVECFYPSPDQCQRAYMMTSAATFKYAYYVPFDAQVIQLPYQGGKYSMVIILPARKDGILHLRRDLSYQSLKDVVQAMDEKEIMLKLPRFTIEFKSDLVPTLTKLGARDLFSDNANLPGMIAGGKKSKVNAFVHSAKIEVNEKGTKAGAASAASVVPLMSAYVPQFIADHPFYFYIFDESENTVVFSGKLSSPDAVTSDGVLNQVVEVQPLSSTAEKRPTIIAHEPHVRPYPTNSNGEPIFQRVSNQLRYEEKPIQYP